MTTRSMPRQLGLGLALVTIVLSVAPAVARTPTGELQAMIGEVNAILTDAATEGRPRERVSSILDLVERRFAFRVAAAAALGQPWGRLTPAGQSEFVGLFAETVERAFVMALATKARIDDGLDVSYRSEAISGDEAMVLTTIAARAGDLPLGYRMVRSGESWLIADVVLDGISFVDNYRAQFDRVIRTSSYQDLVARMQAKRLDVPEWWPDARVTRVHEVVAGVREPSAPPTPVVDAAVATARIEARPIAAPLQPPSQVSRPALGEIRESPSDALPAAVSLTPSVTPSHSPRTTYWLQAGAFRDAERVSRLASALHALKLTVLASEAEVQAGGERVRVTRVRVGPFANAGDALAALVELHRRGHEAFLAIDRD
jgi:phospholipid transport system substrate-binding protein